MDWGGDNDLYYVELNQIKTLFTHVGVGVGVGGWIRTSIFIYKLARA